MREQVTFNPQSSALAKAFSDVSTAMFAHPPEERAQKQAMADYYRAKADEAGMVNRGRATAQQSLADIMKQYTAAGQPVKPWTNPDTGEVIQNTDLSTPLESSEQRATRVQPLIAQGMLSGDKDMASMFKEALSAVNAYGAPDDMRRSMVIGGHNVTPDFAPTAAEGDRIRQTVSDQTSSRDIAKINATPLSDSQVKGRFLNENFDKLDKLNPNQQKALGALPSNGTSISMDPDGNVSVNMGGSGGGTAGVKVPGGVVSNAVEDFDASNQALTTLDLLLGTETTPGIIKKENFGLVGTGRGIVHGGAQQLDALKSMLDNNRDALAQEIIATPDKFEKFDFAKYFDPSLPQQELLLNDLASQYARMRNPKGTISNRDMDDAKAMIGGSGMLSSYPEFAARGQILRKQLISNRERSQGRMGGAPVKPPVPAANSPAMPAPGGAVQVQTADEALALPSGTRFITPDGREKIRP